MMAVKTAGMAELAILVVVTATKGQAWASAGQNKQLELSNKHKKEKRKLNKRGFGKAFAWVDRLEHSLEYKITCDANRTHTQVWRKRHFKRKAQKLKLRVSDLYRQPLGV